MMEENICELNNRSKVQVRPENYVTDPGRIYMTVPFNKGKFSIDCPYQLLYWSFVLSYCLSLEEEEAWPSGLERWI